MGNIEILSQDTIDKIAAGEVIERPSSIVKELVENSIDAGALNITVEIKGGGSELIRITDNGRGIEKVQVPLAFIRHATSKIKDIDDLVGIGTLGFRGEALSSIAAVAKVELTTRTDLESTATYYVIEGGVEKLFDETGAPKGTTFVVKDLFYNTPVRAKFLKSKAAEAGYISSYMEQLALSHPDIAFQYIINGQKKISSSGNGNLKDIIYHIYGRDLAMELIEISADFDGLKLGGYVGKPVISRGNRSFENYYVNGRYVKSKIISKAIEDAYKTYMMQHRYPFTVLRLDADGDAVDVNVHPAKLEVRFQDDELIYNCVFDAIREALKNSELIQSSEKIGRDRFPSPVKNKKDTDDIKLELKEETNHRVKEIKEPLHRSVNSTAVNNDLQMSAKKSTIESTKGSTEFSESYGSLNKISDAVLEEKADYDAARRPFVQMDINEAQNSGELEILGQVFDTYWLVVWQGELYAIDQHAAHERIIFERLKTDFANRTIQSQMLTPPYIISLNASQQAVLEQYIEVFKEYGFEISPFGGNDYAISAVPSVLYGYSSSELFLELLSQLYDLPKGIPENIFTSKIATMACKAAVKGNMSMTDAEFCALLKELFKLENPYNCPHGRPTMISISRQELEKKFKRIL